MSSGQAIDVREVIADCIHPRHFFSRLELAWEHAADEEIAWEIYRGRLLDPAHTRQKRRFECWNIFRLEGGERSAEPVLSVKLDGAERTIHITRAILCHAWEGYHAGDNVYLSRETRKWVRELVGSIELDTESLRRELIGLIFKAVIGVSRLPLTSVEAPLPDFALGQLAYFYRPNATQHPQPLKNYAELIEHACHAGSSELEQVKLLETVLRSLDAPEIAPAATTFARRRGLSVSLPALLRRLFDEVALSPYTNFVPSTLAFLHALTAAGHLSAVEHVDFLSYLLRQLVRHLTAYDLKVFHHQGANYPDALLLDAALKDYLAWIERTPELFLPSEKEPARARVRRRALRQACMLRRFHEGWPVPDAPTSPGENARALPAPHVRVPDEQITMVDKRSKRLYDNDPLTEHMTERGRETLAASIRDLSEDNELRELGMAVFLDRPLGIAKAPGEPDQTPLLSYEAFSTTIAERRLAYLAELSLITDPALSECQRKLRQLVISGQPLPPAEDNPRPGSVSLHDARRVADDFLILRTTRKSVAEFLELYDFTSLLPREQWRLIMRGDRAGTLHVFDANLHKRLELQIDPQAQSQRRAGMEVPRLIASAVQG